MSHKFTPTVACLECGWEGARYLLGTELIEEINGKPVFAYSCNKCMSTSISNVVCRADSEKEQLLNEYGNYLLIHANGKVKHSNHVVETVTNFLTK